MSEWEMLRVVVRVGGVGRGRGGDGRVVVSWLLFIIGV